MVEGKICPDEWAKKLFAWNSLVPVSPSRCRVCTMRAAVLVPLSASKSARSAAAALCRFVRGQRFEHREFARRESGRGPLFRRRRQRALSADLGEQRVAMAFCGFSPRADLSAVTASSN